MDRTVVELLRQNADHARAFDGAFDDLQSGQWPDAVTVCCSDSRVLQDQMWGNDEPGHLFTCSNIGNRVTQRTATGTAVSGDVLYPITHAETDTAIVVGHTGCGAVTATYDALREDIREPPGIQHCIDLLGPDIEAGVAALPAGLDRPAAINRLVEYNVDRQIERLRRSDAVPETVTTVGVVYDFQNVYGGRRGEVHVVNVEGETDVGTLRSAHPEIEGRIDRLWTP